MTEVVGDKESTTLVDSLAIHEGHVLNLAKNKDAVTLECMTCQEELVTFQKNEYNDEIKLI